jgi:hypothetical protein
MSRTLPMAATVLKSRIHDWIFPGPPNATRSRCKALLTQITSLLFWTVALARVADAASTARTPGVDDTVVTHLESHGPPHSEFALGWRIEHESIAVS